MGLTQRMAIVTWLLIDFFKSCQFWFAKNFSKSKHPLPTFMMSKTKFLALNEWNQDLLMTDYLLYCCKLLIPWMNFAVIIMCFNNYICQLNTKNYRNQRTILFHSTTSALGSILSFCYGQSFATMLQQSVYYLSSTFICV